MIFKNQITVIAFMTGLITVGHISTNIYMPSLPAMAVFFNTDMAHVQMTVSAYLAAFAVGQLVYGPLSDRFGRRPVLVLGLLVFVVSTSMSIIMPFFSRSIEMLIFLRAIQALGASAGPIIARAIMRDLYSREQMAKLMAYVALAMGLAPALAPILGGYLELWFDWRASFLVILIFSIGVFIITYAILPETNNFRKINAAEHPITLATNFVLLMRVRAYWRYMLIGSFVFSGMFAFMTAAPFIVIQLMGYSAVTYGWLSFSGIVGYMLGSFVLSQISDHLSIDITIPIGVGIVALSGAALLLVALAGVLTLVSLFLPLAVMAFGMALMFPSTMAGAISIYPQIAGAGAALYGFFQMLLAAFVVWLVSVIADGSHMPLIWIVSCSMFAACLVAMMGPWRSTDQIDPVSEEWPSRSENS